MYTSEIVARNINHVLLPARVKGLRFQADISKKLNVDPATVNRWLTSGSRTMSTKNIDRLAKLFGIPTTLIMQPLEYREYKGGFIIEVDESVCKKYNITYYPLKYVFKNSAALIFYDFFQHKIDIKNSK